jgi:hypothetical protein
MVTSLVEKFLKKLFHIKLVFFFFLRTHLDLTMAELETAAQPTSLKHIFAIF